MDLVGLIQKLGLGRREATQAIAELCPATGISSRLRHGWQIFMLHDDCSTAVH
jgi:hypothetical protein